MDPNDPSLFELEPAPERRCTRCGKVRPLAMFYIAAEARAKATGRKHSNRSCRYCMREMNAVRRGPRLALIRQTKADAGCADCGLHDPDHPEIFDFDHLPGFKKTRGVSTFITQGTIEELIAEIAKCEVVCANCHRIRTWRVRGPASFGIDRGDESGVRPPPTLRKRELDAQRGLTTEPPGMTLDVPEA